ncbi:inositol monophosphatase [Candidatus Woesearchaeota archaeon]|nr:inositol monophosphatase [Candidatus Woesearchaeota archaeon]
MNPKEVAIKAAKAAAKIHLKYFRTELDIKTKSSHHDQVTVADIESEKAIVRIIRKSFPDHNFLCEEHDYKKTPSPYTWIIDPLDGTNNYAHGIPIFCTSIALAKKGDIILGVILDPTRKEMFVAEKGKGAFLNGKRISVTKAASLKQSILVTGFYYDRGKPALDALNNIRKFFNKGIIGIRRLGSAALDFCYVASGRFDGYWEFKLNPWDFAAGSLIVQEAGGTVTNKQGKKLPIKSSYVVATNKKIHAKVLEVLG